MHSTDKGRPLAFRLKDQEVIDVHHWTVDRWPSGTSYAIIFGNKNVVVHMMSITCYILVPLASNLADSSDNRPTCSGTRGGKEIPCDGWRHLDPWRNSPSIPWVRRYQLHRRGVVTRGIHEQSQESNVSQHAFQVHPFWMNEEISRSRLWTRLDGCEIRTGISRF